MQKNAKKIEGKLYKVINESYIEVIHRCFPLMILKEAIRWK